MISPEEAWQRIASRIHALDTATVDRRRAVGRVLSQPLAATTDVPGTDVSSMDGYALHGPVAAGSELPVDGIVAAGDPPGATLRKGTAKRIMTGAPIPDGCDRVLPIEETSEAHGRVTVQTTADTNAWIRRRGEILALGSRLLDAGALLTPGALGLVATHGYGEVPIVRPPRVAVLTTGDEVVTPEETPAPGQLRDSHTDFLTSALSSLGIAARSLGIAPDNIDQLRALVAEGLGDDVLILTGGVSMGEFDLVEGVLDGFGCSALFDAVSIQPGKPMVAAVHDAGHVFALPGNPASAMVCFWLFVRPALRRMMGHDDSFWAEAFSARLLDPLPGARGRDRFLPAEVAIEKGRATVRGVVPMGSHDLAAYARGTGLVRIPAGSAPREAGDDCEVLPLSTAPSTL